tara:strand:+ start:327 stop:545 length:219 start_codon:yes stop_codon:yes gene_type:complete
MECNFIHTPDCMQLSSEMIPTTEKKKKNEISIIKTRRELEREQKQIGENHPLQVNIRWNKIVYKINEYETFL